MSARHLAVAPSALERNYAGEAIYYLMTCHDMSCYDMAYHVMILDSWHAVPCPSLPCHVVACDAML